MVQATTTGLFASLQRFADTGLSALQNRIELFAIELREEKARFLELIFWASAALFLGMLAVISFTAAVLLVCPADARPWIAGVFVLLYGGGAIAAALLVRSKLVGRTPAFAETVAQLKKDRETLVPGD